jgi:hypothetical protein
MNSTHRALSDGRIYGGKCSKRERETLLGEKERVRKKREE